MELQTKELVVPKHYWTQIRVDPSQIERHTLANCFRNALYDPKYKKYPEFGTLHFRVDGNERLKAIAKQFQLKMENIWLFIWHTVLSVYLYCEFTVVGIEITTENDEFVIAPHVHEQESSASIVEMIRTVGKHQTDLIRIFKYCNCVENEEVPLSIDNLLLYNNVSNLNSFYPLEINVADSEFKASLQIQFSKQYFQATDISGIAGTIQVVLEQVISDPIKLVRDLVYIRPLEQYNLLNPHNIYYKSNLTVVDIFHQQALNRPDSPALYFGGKRLTYQQLNTKANQLASFIRARTEVKPNTVIAFCLQPSELVVIAMLGIWKTGAAFTSVDSRIPDVRVVNLLKNVHPNLVLTDNQTFEKLNNLCLEDDACEVQNLNICDFNLMPPDQLEIKINIRSLAYIIFTSGTTGNPKGILAEHGNLANTTRDCIRTEEASQDEVAFVTYYHGFTAFITTVAVAFREGGAILLAPPGLTSDPIRFSQYSVEHAVTQIHATPSMLSVLDLSEIKTLKRVYFTGEILREHVFKKIQFCTENVMFFNNYGCSEAPSIMFTELNAFTPFLQNTTPNNVVCLLSSSWKCLPVGAIGEICISGGNVTRGYLNLEELTSRSFIQNPFARPGYEHMYRTGDLARRHLDGSIEYIGRRDLQVKINGIRVELGEIESVISSAPGVKHCVAVAKRNANQDVTRLVAYFTASTKGDEGIIRRFAESKLPTYMIPTNFIQLDKIPLTINGKVDRVGLQKLNVALDSTNYVKAIDKKHQMFASIWEEVLELPRFSVGINDSFFALGGNSLLATKAINQLNKELGSKISVARIFSHNSIAEFFEGLEISAERHAEIEVLSRTSSNAYRLSSQQERIWMWYQYAGELSSLNLAEFYETLNEFSLDRFSSAISAIVHRHESLRTVFKINEDGFAYQCILESPQVTPVVYSIQKQDINAQIKMLLSRNYNPAEDFPIQVSALKIENEIKYVGIVVHHLAFDFWSKGLFMQELCRFYNFGENSSPVSFQYVDYTHAQRLSFEDEPLLYWSEEMEGFQIARLPYDVMPDDDREYVDGKKVTFELSKETYARLQALCSDLNVSLFSVLLTGYFLMLSEVCGQDDIVVMTPFAGRDRFEFENIIGIFMRELPLRQKNISTTPVKELIRSVWNTIARANEHQSVSIQNLFTTVGYTTDPYKDRDLGKVFFQANEFDKSHDPTIPLKVYYPNEAHRMDDDLAYNMHLSAVLEIRGYQITGSFIYVDPLFHRNTALKCIKIYVQTLHWLAKLVNNSDGTDKNELIKNLPVKHKVNIQQPGGISENFVNPISSSLEISDANLKPPVSHAEKTVCKIWAEILGLPVAKVGLDTDFFKYSGNGILGVRVIKLMQNTLGINVSLKKLYELKTVENILKYYLK